MKLKNTIMFISGLILGILLTVLLLAYIFPKMMFTVSESKYDFDQTVEVLSQSVSDNKWSMPHQYDLQQTMAKHGFEVLPVKVLSICKPDVAVRILNNDIDRHISAMMPCRVAIYKKADGKTYVSRMNAGLFAKLMGGKASAVMGDAGTGSEEIIKSVSY